MNGVRRNITAAACSALLTLATILVPRGLSYASDHLDTPTVIADPAADIGDVYAWTAPDGRHLNLVMDIVSHRFSDRLQYVFHVESGQRFGRTTAATTIVCRFDVANVVECWTGTLDHVHGDASRPAGLVSEHGRFRVFAGLRDDPFFNNVKGTRAAYDVAGAALGGRSGARCHRFDPKTTRAIRDAWRHTDGAAATNFLAGWKTSALVISIDLDAVNRGGNLLAVWAAVHKAPRAESARRGLTHAAPAMPALGTQIERTARPLIKNGLVGGPLAADSVSNARKERYNRVARTGWAQFAASIEESLALYDGFDGTCGNQWLADPHAPPTGAHATGAYARLATMLADDRLWINSASTVCTQFLAVERAASSAPGAASGDCGGRTPSYDASNVFRSLLANGTTSGIDDGLTRDDKVPSPSVFPFLAAP